MTGDISVQLMIFIGMGIILLLVYGCVYATFKNIYGLFYRE